MQRIIFSTILGLLILPGAGAFAQQKTAYINMSNVFEGYYKTKRSEAALHQQEDAYKKQAQNIGKQAEALKKQRDDLQEKALNVALSDSVRATNRHDAQTADDQYKAKQKEWQQFVQDKQKQLRQQYLDARGELVKQIVTFVKGFAKDKGYDVVYDVSGMTNNFLPVVIYYPKDKDITQPVLKALNKGHEAELKDQTKAPATAAAGKGK